MKLLITLVITLVTLQTSSSLFGGNFNPRKLSEDFSHTRRLTASELMNWMHAVHFYHNADGEEKKNTVDNLEKQVKLAGEENNKIGTLIKSAQDYFKKLKDLKDKAMSPGNLIKSGLSGLTKSFGFRRRLQEKRLLADLDGLLNSVQGKITEGQTNQENIKESIDGASKGIETLKSVSSLFGDDAKGVWQKIKDFFSNLFVQFDDNKLISHAHMNRNLKRDFYADRGDDNNKRILEMVCHPESVKGMRNLSSNVLRYIHHTPKHEMNVQVIKKIVHNANINNFFKNLIQGIITSMNQVKTEKKDQNQEKNQIKIQSQIPIQFSLEEIKSITNINKEKSVPIEEDVVIDEKEKQIPLGEEKTLITGKEKLIDRQEKPFLSNGEK